MTDQNRISCKCRLNSYLDYLLSLGGQWHTNPLLIATVADLCNSSYAGKELLEKILVVSFSCHCPPSLLFQILAGNHMFKKILAESRYSIINHPLLVKDLLLEDPQGK